MLAVGLITVACILFLFRVLFFAGNYGGVEHDSGWYLGVAKNLALRGIYASYTNTVATNGIGEHPSIHGRFSVQDAQGYIYFPAGVTAGPGYVVPEALMIKLFGNGWWQYRLWPLLSFAALVGISFFAVWRIGGFAAFIVFALWLWAIPQFYTAYAFEAFGEDIAFLFLFVGLLVAHYVSMRKQKVKFMFLSGVFLSLAYLTKDLYALAICGIGAFFIWDVYALRKEWRYLVKKWLLFALGLALLPVAFLGYERWFLLSHFGPQGVWGVQEDFRLHFESNGSGLSNLNLLHMDWNFVYKKVLIWMDVGFAQPLLVWSMLMLFPIVVFKFINKQYRVFIVSLYLAMVVSFAWYILLSPTGWARHAWQAVMIGIMLIAIGIGTLYNRCSTVGTKMLFVFAVIVVFLPSIEPANITLSPMLNGETITRWKSASMVRGLNGFPSNDILSLDDQKGIVQFFDSSVHKQDRVYYVGWFLVAEVSPLVDKVFYTLDRYESLNGENPDGGKSYAIFGPYQQGTWSMESPDYIVAKTNQICDEIVYQNPSYLVCTLQKNLHYINSAY